MGFNIIAPYYMEFLHLNWYIADYYFLVRVLLQMFSNMQHFSSTNTASVIDIWYDSYHCWSTSSYPFIRAIILVQSQGGGVLPICTICGCATLEGDIFALHKGAIIFYREGAVCLWLLVANFEGWGLKSQNGTPVYKNQNTAPPGPKT